jgi:hypothetical protein
MMASGRLRDDEQRFIQYCPEAGDFAVNYAYRYGVFYGMVSANHLFT